MKMYIDYELFRDLIEIVLDTEAQVGSELTAITLDAVNHFIQSLFLYISDFIMDSDEDDTLNIAIDSIHRKINELYNSAVLNISSRDKFSMDDRELVIDILDSYLNSDLVSHKPEELT